MAICSVYSYHYTRYWLIPRNRKEERSSCLGHIRNKLAKAYSMNDEIRVKRPSEMCMLNMSLASHIDTTKQKERLSHSLSYCSLNWRFVPDEKERLTLFLFDGISPPSECKDNQKFRCRCYGLGLKVFFAPEKERYTTITAVYHSIGIIHQPR